MSYPRRTVVCDGVAGTPVLFPARVRPVDDVESGGVRVEPLNAQDYARIRVLLRQYADFPLGLVDASVVAVCERLGELKVVTLDHRHFSVIRPAHTRRPLRLVPDA